MAPELNQRQWQPGFTNGLLRQCSACSSQPSGLNRGQQPVGLSLLSYLESALVHMAGLLGLLDDFEPRSEALAQG